MELQNLVLDDLPSIRYEPVADSLSRAANTDEAWQPFFQRLIEVVTFLKSCKPDVCLDALLLPDHPPKLAVHGPNKASVDLWADYYDRREVAAPSGLHFRMQIKRDGSKLTRDVRTSELNEVARQFRLAFSLHER